MHLTEEQNQSMNYIHIAKMENKKAKKHCDYVV